MRSRAMPKLVRTTSTVSVSGRFPGQFDMAVAHGPALRSGIWSLRIELDLCGAYRIVVIVLRIQSVMADVIM